MVSVPGVVALALYAFGAILGFLAGREYEQKKRLLEEGPLEG